MKQMIKEKFSDNIKVVMRKQLMRKDMRKYDKTITGNR